MAELSAALSPPASEAGSSLTRREVKTLTLSSLGGALEYFDFTLFVFFATIIGQLFFPPDQPGWVKEFQAFSVFALGWIARPIGGTIIAHYGDRLGRKKLFMLTIFMMAAPTLLIGLLPTYASIGVWAPVLLIICRLLQGCAMAGEVPGSIVFVAEHVGRSRIGRACAFIFAVLYAGLFLGSLSAAVMASQLTQEQLLSWGWRVPFILGGVFGLIAVYLRRFLEETPLFEQIRDQKQLSSQLPLKIVVTKYWPAAIFVLILSGFISAVVTGVFQYLPAPLQQLYKFPREVVLEANSVAILTLAIVGGGWGWLGDKIGVLRAFAIGCVATTIAVLWFFFYRLEALPPDGSGLALAWMIVAVPGACVCLAPTLAVLSFPTAVRYTGFAFPYNVGAAIFAGMIPMFLTLASQAFGRTAPAYLVLLAAVVGLIAMPFAPAIFRRAEEDEA